MPQDLNVRLYADEDHSTADMLYCGFLPVQQTAVAFLGGDDTATAIGLQRSLGVCEARLRRVRVSVISTSGSVKQVDMYHLLLPQLTPEDLGPQWRGAQVVQPRSADEQFLLTWRSGCSAMGPYSQHLDALDADGFIDTKHQAWSDAMIQAMLQARHAPGQMPDMMGGSLFKPLCNAFLVLAYNVSRVLEQKYGQQPSWY